jgi:hypothetical protein
MSLRKVTSTNSVKRSSNNIVSDLHKIETKQRQQEGDGPAKVKHHQITDLKCLRNFTDTLKIYELDDVRTDQEGMRRSIEAQLRLDRLFHSSDEDCDTIMEGMKARSKLTPEKEMIGSASIKPVVERNMDDEQKFLYDIYMEMKHQIEANPGKNQHNDKEIFGNDDFILQNKGLKNKWYIQNLNNLRKANTQFREYYLHMELANLDEYRDQKEFLETFFVGRQPRDIVKGKELFERMLTDQKPSKMVIKEESLDLLEISAIKPGPGEPSDYPDLDTKNSKLSKNQDTFFKDPPKIGHHQKQSRSTIPSYKVKKPV